MLEDSFLPPFHSGPDYLQPRESCCPIQGGTSHSCLARKLSYRHAQGVVSLNSIKLRFQIDHHSRWTLGNVGANSLKLQEGRKSYKKTQGLETKEQNPRSFLISVAVSPNMI